MSYIALYRNYRPTSFKDVAGQSHIITTLKNSVANGKTSHAYIFSGRRGIGKTTIARILAKAVNCLNPINGEPCGECEHCKLINANETPDIIELDAASNNGVDEIRNLLDKVNFLPTSLNKKVYIIDEVHMLSTSAFNALLKTLEEPPLHVMFILATTEPYKVPETILSRCQRFDFQQLSIIEIVDRLKEIVEKENISIEEDALYRIAECAEGGMRDAVNILDQASTYTDSTIKIDDIDYLTGKVSDDYLIELVNSFNKKDSESALKTIDLLLNSGKDVSRIVSNLIIFLKDTLLYKSASNSIEQKNIYNKEEFKTLSNTLNNKDIFFYIDVLIDTYNKIKYSNNSRIYLDVAVLKIINGFNNVEDLANSIEKIQEEISNGNFGTGSNFNPELETKVSELNLQMKKVVNELDKLDIRNFKEDTIAKFKYFENTQTSSPVEKYDDTRLLNIIDNLKTELDLVKNKEVSIPEAKDFTNDINELKELINSKSNPVVENKTVEYDDSLIIEKISTLENKIVELTNKLNDTEEKQTEIQKRYNPFSVKLEEKPIEEVKVQEQDEIVETKVEVVQPQEVIEEKPLEEVQTVVEEVVDTEPEEEPIQEETKPLIVENEEPIQEETKPLIVEKEEPIEVKPEPVKVEEVKKPIAEPVYEEPKATFVEPSKNHETTFIVENKKEDIYNPYDIKVLEKLLHESRLPESRNEMILLKDKWSKLTSFVSVETSTLKILKDGVLTANGKNTLLIIYPSAQYCNRLMGKSIHEESKKLLKDIFNKDYDFMALPEDTWNEKRNEYYNKYRIGIMYPELSPINNPDLKVVDVKETKSSVEELEDFAKSIFGEDTVKRY